MGKYLILDYEGKWKNDVFRMFYHMANYFVENLGYKIIDTYDLEPRLSIRNNLLKDQEGFIGGHKGQKLIDTIRRLDVNNAKNVKDMDQIDHILVFENHDGILLNDIFCDLYDLCSNPKTQHKYKLYLFSDDIHKCDDRKKASNYYELFTKIFVTYYVPFFEQYPHFCGSLDTSSSGITPIQAANKKKIIWMPHCVSELNHAEFNDDPFPKIGLLGHTAKKVYPFRSYLAELKEKDPEFSNLIVEKGHPSKKYTPVNYNNVNACIGQTFYDTLNSLLCNFTCSLIKGYAVCKYLEIPYTGSLLLCDPTHDDISKLGLVDGKTCIIYRNREEIKTKIRWILDPKNRQEVDRIRKNGYDLIRKRHLVSIRCREMDKEIDMAINTL